MFQRIVLTDPKSKEPSLAESSVYGTSQIDVERFAQELMGSNRPSGLLPPAVRWVSTDGMCWLLERPPTRVSILYVPTSKEEAKKIRDRVPVSIPLPWQLYFMDVSPSTNTPMYVWASGTQLHNLNQPVGTYPLPNTSANGRICWPSNFYGDYRRWRAETERTTAEIFVYLLNSFWTSGFNDNMGPWPYNSRELLDKIDYAGLSPNKYEREHLLLERLEQASIEDMLAVNWRGVDLADKLEELAVTQRPAWSRVCTAARDARTKGEA